MTKANALNMHYENSQFIFSLVFRDRDRDRDIEILKTFEII